MLSLLADAFSFLLPGWIELPASYVEGLAKGLSHKYIKRVPTGKVTKTGKPRYRYFYHVGHGGTVANHEHFVVGASFRHDGGHWHITEADGDKLTIRHDETGEEQKLSRADLGKMLGSYHAEGIAGARAAALADLAAGRANKASPKQLERLEARAKGVGAVETETPKPRTETGSPKPERSRKPRSKAADALEQVGDHIWGSRKDLAKLGYIDSSKDLDSMSYADAATVVRKSRMLAPLSLEQAQKDGKTPGATHLALAVMALIREKPDDSKAGRAAYVDDIRRVQGGLDRARSVGDVVGVLQEIGRMRQSGRAAKESVETFPNTSEGRAAGHRRTDQMNKENPGSKHGLYGRRLDGPSGFEILRDIPQPGDSLGAKFVKAVTESHKSKDLRDALKTSVGILDRRLIPPDAARKLGAYGLDGTGPVLTEEQAWDWLRASTAKTKGAVEKTAKPKKEANTERGHSTAKEESAALVRVGGVDVGAADPKRTKDTFGFREIDYGNYMSQADREHHTKALEEATHDLTEILGIDPKQASFNGRLGIAMGARGAGKAAAHYEPGRHAINLTKFAGGGSYAHEWGHALDDILGRHYLPDTGNTRGQYVTHSYEHSKVPSDIATAYRAVHQAMHSASDESRDALNQRRAGASEKVATVTAERAAWRKEMEPFLSMYPDETTRSYELARAQKRMKDEEDARDSTASSPYLKPAAKAKQLDAHDERLDVYREQLDAIKRNRVMSAEDTAKHEALKARREDILARVTAANLERDAIYKVSTKTSRFKQGAAGLDKDKPNGYWSSPHEMFARAFESYVADKLAEKGRKNTYLTSDWKGADHERYPQGAERQNINAALDGFMATLRTGKHLEKALANLPTWHRGPLSSLADAFSWP